MSKKTNTVAVEYVIYQSPAFNPNAITYNLMTEAAAIGDMQHFMAYGFTMGGAMYKNRRAANWNALSNNVYTSATYNRSLRAFRSTDNSQVIIMGRTYMSIYQSGENQKKIVNYSDIERVSSVGEEIRIWVRKNNANLYVSIRPVAEGTVNLVKSLKFYMSKAGKDMNQVSTIAATPYKTPKNAASAMSKLAILYVTMIGIVVIGFVACMASM